MHCDGCHVFNWPHERPSLARLQGQLVCSIRLNSVIHWILYWLIMTADIDDRDHCLQGRSIVRIGVGVDVTVPVDLLATLKMPLVDWRIDDREQCLRGRSIVTVTFNVNASRPCSAGKPSRHTESSTDHGDWHIDDREQCLRGRSIVMIIISGTVIALVRLHYCPDATASMWETLYIINFCNGNVFGIYSTWPTRMVLELDYFYTELVLGRRTVARMGYWVNFHGWSASIAGQRRYEAD